MMFSIICYHTGKKIHIHSGKPAALVGDLVSCPITGHGDNPIIEGSQYMMFEGKAVAVDGCKTACGCALISSLPSVGSD